MTQTERYRLAAGLLVSLVSGVVIGRLDSSSGWDDTGVTAGLLVVAAAASTLVAGRFPWLLAITTGMFVPLFELPGSAGGGALVAFLFSGIGAAIGWGARLLRAG
jgi:hypothetical protein